MATEYEMTHQRAVARIRYLEMKVEALKHRCVEALEQQSTRVEFPENASLFTRLQAERERSAELLQEVNFLKSHRDDVVRQIQHQHEHILYLTDKIHRLERAAKVFAMASRISNLVRRVRVPANGELDIEEVERLRG